MIVSFISFLQNADTHTEYNLPHMRQDFKSALAAQR